MRLPLAAALILTAAAPGRVLAQDGETFTISDPDNDAAQAPPEPEPAGDGATFSIVDPANTALVVEDESPSTPASFQSALFRGAWRLQAALDTGFENHCDKWSCEDVFELRNRLDLRLEKDVSPSLRAVVETRLDHFVVGERPEGETFLGYNAERVKGHFEAEVRDAWLRWKHGPLRVTVGNQVVAWGVLDMGSAQDVVNPVDYRNGLAPGDEPPRIPVLAARAVASLGPVSLDGVIAPFFEPHRIQLFGSDFAMLGGAGELPPDLAMLDLLREMLIDETTEDDFQRLLQATEVPRDLPQDSTMGLRVGASFAGLDVHAAYLYAWDRFPYSEKGAGLSRKATYKRRHVVGVDASYTISELVVRAEAGWSPQRTLFDEAMKPLRKPTLLGGLALDWTHSTDLSASVEGFWFRVLDLDAGESLYLLEADTYGVAGGVTSSWLDEDLKIRLFGLYLVSLGDVILAPDVAYRLADGHDVGLAFQLYEGKAESIGGKYDHNDQVVARYTASF